MKRRSLQIAIAFFLMSALFAVQQEENIMKLVKTRTGFVIVEFKNGTPLFYDRFLEAEMKERGIAIPVSRQNEFNGKDTIYIGDPLFQQAFAEIYVPLTIASSNYQWEH